VQQRPSGNSSQVVPLNGHTLGTLGEEFFVCPARVMVENPGSMLCVF
jgi:hypothetical protein